MHRDITQLSFATFRRLTVGLLILCNGCKPAMTKPGGEFNAGGILVLKEEQLIHRFQVTNPTGQVVRISNVDKSCTCTEAKLDKLELGPYETTFLTLNVILRNVKSDMTTSCTLRTDSSLYPNWEYIMHFRTFPRIMASEPSLSFGSFTPDDIQANGAFNNPLPEQPITVSVYSRPGENLGPLAWKSNSGTPDVGFAVSLKPKGSEQVINSNLKVQEYIASISLNKIDHKLSGTQHASIVFSLEDGTYEIVSLGWKLGTSITSTPANINFVLDNSNKPSQQKRMLISSADNRPFRILAVTQSPRAIVGLTVSVDDDITPEVSNERHLIVVKIANAMLEIENNESNNSLKVITDHPKQREIAIPWRMTRLAIGSASVSAKTSTP